jgi:hypothetical protein
MIVTLAAIPLIIVFKKPPSGTSADHTMVIE